MTEFDQETPQALRWSVDGWTPEQALAALRSLEAEALGPRAVPFFATVSHDAQGQPEWTVPGRAAYGFYELDEASRENLKARAGRRIGQLRRAIEARARAGDEEAPQLGAMLRQAVEIPGWGSIYAINGEPVLSGWGHVGSDGKAHGLLLEFDDGVSLPALAQKIGFHWLTTLTVLAVVLLAGIAAAAWAPLAWLPVDVGLPRCKVEAGALGLIDDYGRQRAANEELLRQIADARRSADRKSLSCPINVVELPPPPPLPTVKEPPPQQAAVPPPQPPKDDLPDDKWKKKEISMLQGCWTRISNLRIGRVDGKEFPVKSWKICFDGRGRGKQELVWENGTTCAGPVTARFAPSGDLRLDEAQAPCSDNSYNFSAITQCSRRPDGTADCVRRLPNGAVDEGRLRR